jgi:HAD superfamily hydrolase (TIGR01549 family)
MGRVKLVSLDMEGTLIDHTFSNAIWEHEIPALYAEKHGLDLDVALAWVKAEYGTVGEGRAEWYDVDYWFRRLGLEADWRQLIRERTELICVYPDAAEALRRLREAYPLVVSSNTIREFLELQVEAVGEIFTHVFSAPSDFGTVKKDAGFYRMILNEIGLKPTHVAHVGDHKEFDYRAAKSLGLEAYHLDRSGEAGGPDTVRDLLEFADRLVDT